MDTQQPWTFLSEWINGAEAAPPTGGPAAVSNVRRTLSGYLKYVPKSQPRWLFQGRVVWIQMKPTRFRVDDSGQQVPSLYSDIVNWELIAKRVRVDPVRQSDWLLPAAVVTNDEYLPQSNDRRFMKGIFPLVTVVPLVRSPELSKAGKWSISHAKAGGDWVPITLCLLTLNFWTDKDPRDPIIVASLPGYEDWALGDEDRLKLIDRVALNLGL